MFEGDIVNGELEIGQTASAVKQIKSASEILKEIWAEFLETKQRIAQL